MSDKEVCPECGKHKGATVSGSSKAWVFKPVKCACSSSPVTGHKLQSDQSAKPLDGEALKPIVSENSSSAQAPENDSSPRASEIVTGDHEPISVDESESHEPKSAGRSRKKNRNRRSKNRSKGENRKAEITGDHEPISVAAVTVDAGMPASEPATLDLSASASAVVTGDHEPVSVSEPISGAETAEPVLDATSPSQVETGDHQPVGVDEPAPAESVGEIVSDSVSSCATPHEESLPETPEPTEVSASPEPPPPILAAETKPEKVEELSVKSPSGDAVVGALASEKMKPIVAEEGLDSGTWATAGDSVKGLSPSAPRSFRDLPGDSLKTNNGAKGDIGTAVPRSQTPLPGANGSSPVPPVPRTLLGTDSGGFSSSSSGFSSSSGGLPAAGAPPPASAGFSSSSNVFSSSSSVFSSSSNVFSTSTNSFSAQGAGTAGGGTVAPAAGGDAAKKPISPKTPVPGIGSFPSNKDTGSGVYTGTGIVFNDLKDFPSNDVPSTTGNYSPRSDAGGGSFNNPGVSPQSGGFSSSSGGFSSTSGRTSTSSGGFSSGASSVSAGNSDYQASGEFAKKRGYVPEPVFPEPDLGDSSSSGTSIMSTTSASGLLSDEMVRNDAAATTGGSYPADDQPENWVAVSKNSRDKSQSVFKHDSELQELIHPASVRDGQDPVVTRNAILQTLRRRKIKTLITLFLAIAIAWVGYSYMSKQAEANKEAQASKEVQATKKEPAVSAAPKAKSSASPSGNSSSKKKTRKSRRNR
ncbi:hypothetical protein KF728_23305 [Candidatus Obscuribacterales bacterium]|nr:hypothetical protein [Candidatus Obscuribacterales bacterium]